MASTATIRAVIELVAQRYRLPRAKLAEETPRWLADLAKVDDGKLRQVVENWPNAKAAPTLAEVRKALGLLDGADGASSSPPGCPACERRGSRLLMRHVRDANDEVHAEQVAVACDCALGESLAEAWKRPTLARLRERWGNDPGTLEVIVDPGPLDHLPPEERRARAERSRQRAEEAIAFIRGGEPTFVEGPPSTRPPEPTFEAGEIPF